MTISVARRYWSWSITSNGLGFLFVSSLSVLNFLSREGPISSCQLFRLLFFYMTIVSLFLRSLRSVCDLYSSVITFDMEVRRQPLTFITFSCM